LTLYALRIRGPDISAKCRNIEKSKEKVTPNPQEAVSDFLLAEMRHIAERPSLRELRERLAKRRPISTAIPPAKAVRQERELH